MHGDTNQGIEAFKKAAKLVPNDENLLLSAVHRLRYMLLLVYRIYCFTKMDHTVQYFYSRYTQDTL